MTEHSDDMHAAHNSVAALIGERAAESLRALRDRLDNDDE